MLKGFEEMLHFWQRDPKLHLRFCRLFTCFLYPRRLSLELLKGGKSAHSLGVQRDSKGREESGRNSGDLALREPGMCRSSPNHGAFGQAPLSLFL